MSRPVLAVDFGTSNSYFCKCPHDELMPSPVDFVSDRTGMDTAVLYRKGRSTLVGSVAINAWGEATDEERADYRLLTRFKPEIDSDEVAFKGAVDFLTEVREDARRSHIPFDPTSRDVYFGVPCQASDSYVSSLKRAAHEAGYGDIRTVEEPLGALLHHLSQGDMAPSEAMGSVLVLDFGGGTFDAALLEGLAVKDAWGDWAFGGRLFDDLFYQILLGANPALSGPVADSGTEYYVHWYCSRILKEKFSTTMSRDRGELWTGTAGVYGSIRHLSWGDFISMASSYRPTDEMLRSIGVLCPGMNGPENLLHRLSRLISRGQGASTVILAGGSCLWPFVSDVVQEILPKARLVRSDQPYGVVAKGLSLLPALRVRNDRSIAALRESLPGFLERVRTEVVDFILSRAVDEASSELSSILVGQVIIPVLKEYRSSGGSASNLKDKLREEMELVRDQVDIAMRLHMEKAARAIPKAAVECMARWFREKGIKSLPSHVELALGGDGSGLMTSIDLGSLSPIGSFVASVDRAMAVVVSLVVASLCGGGGIALVATGLPGLIVGGAIGIGGYFAGRRSLKKGIEDVHIPGLISRAMLSDKSIQRTVEKAKKSLASDVNSTVRREWASIEPDLMDSIRDMVGREIKGLSLINQIEGGGRSKDAK
ncbi:MAG: hypothetical protein EOM02_05375 [Synergistales bacterium]|nr:hypothetical protein [Synergistales bacterium]